MGNDGGGGVLLVHSCVLQISCIQGTPPCPVSCRTIPFFATSAMDVDHIDMYPAGAVVNFQRSGCSIVPPKIVCHRGWSPLPSPLLSLLPKLPNLVPNPQPRVQPTKLAVQVAANYAACEPIPVALVEHGQLFRVKYSCQKKWHREPVSE